MEAHKDFPAGTKSNRTRAVPGDSRTIPSLDSDKVRPGAWAGSHAAKGSIGPIEADDNFGDITGWDVFWLAALVIVLCPAAVFALVSPILMIMFAWWALFGG